MSHRSQGSPDTPPVSAHLSREEEARLLPFEHARRARVAHDPLQRVRIERAEEQHARRVGGRGVVGRRAVGAAVKLLQQLGVKVGVARRRVDGEVARAAQVVPAEEVRALGV